jgi:chromosome segregation ATPase
LLLSNGLQFWAGYLIDTVKLLLPALLLVALVTVGLHRRKKKKNHQRNAKGKVKKGLAEHTGPLPPASGEDRQLLLRRCRTDLTRTSATYAALKKDVRTAFAKRQQSLLQFICTNQSLNTTDMDNLQEKVVAYEAQITALQNKIDMLETMPATPANEAHYLRELLGERDQEIERLQNSIRSLEEKNRWASEREEQTVSGEQTGLAEQLRSEIAHLRQVIAERAYQGDMLEENKLHIEFLKNQLEQRVKAAKMLEQQLDAFQAEFKQVSDRLVIADNENAGLQQRMELLNATNADQQDSLIAIHQQMEQTLDLKRIAEEKMLQYRQFIRRIYREFETAADNWPAEELTEAV